MFGTIIGVVIVVLCIISIIVDIKRLKAVKENTKVYKDLEEKVLKMRSDIKLSIKEQKENTISFDELVEKISKQLKNTERLR